MKWNANKINSRGSSIIEMLIVLALLLILASWAFPPFNESIKSNRITAQSNEIVAVLKYARSEAIRRDTDVTVTIDPILGGWNAYVADPANEANIETCPPGQLRCTAANESTLSAFPGTTLMFNNRGYLKETSGNNFGNEFNLFLQHENCSGNNQRRHIHISPTGTITSEALSCAREDGWVQTGI